MPHEQLLAEVVPARGADTMVWARSDGFSATPDFDAAASDRLLGACLRLVAGQGGFWLELPGRVQPRDGLTLSAWVRVQPLAAPPAEPAEVDEDADARVILRLRVSEDEVIAELAHTHVQPDFPGEELPRHRAFSTDTVEDAPGDWRHVAVVWRGPEQQLLLFIDGALRSAHAVETRSLPPRARPMIHVDALPDQLGELRLGPLRLYGAALDAAAIRAERRSEIARHPTIDARHPIAFRLADELDAPRIYSGDLQAPGRPLSIVLENRSHFDLPLWAPGDVLAEGSQLELRFRPGVLAEHAHHWIEGTPPGWRVESRVRDDAGVSLTLVPTRDLVIRPGGAEALRLQHVKADARDGAHSSHAELCYRHPLHTDLHCQRTHVFDVVGRQGRRHSPLRLAVHGERVLLNDGETENTIELWLVNSSTVHGVVFRGLAHRAPSELLLTCDWAESDQDGWALATVDHLQAAEVGASDPSVRIELETQDQGPLWRLRFEHDLVLPPRGRLSIVLDKLLTNLDAGRSRVSLAVRNLPDFWDDDHVVHVDKAPSRVGASGGMELSGDLLVDGAIRSRQGTTADSGGITATRGDVVAAAGDLRTAGTVFDGLGVLVPPGTIVMWYGDPRTPPAGWAVCDGLNGTPNLEGRFVRGITSGEIRELWTDQHRPKVHAPGKKPVFGADAQTLGTAHLPEHSHMASARVGYHNHAHSPYDDGTVTVIEAPPKYPVILPLALLNSIPRATAMRRRPQADLDDIGSEIPDVGSTHADFDRRRIVPDDKARRTFSSRSSVSITVDSAGMADGDRAAIPTVPAYHPLVFIMKLAPPVQGGDA